MPLLKLFFGKIDADVMEAALIYLTISGISYLFLEFIMPAQHCSGPWVRLLSRLRYPCWAISLM